MWVFGIPYCGSIAQERRGWRYGTLNELVSLASSPEIDRIGQLLPTSVKDNEMHVTKLQECMTLHSNKSPVGRSLLIKDFKFQGACLLPENKEPFGMQLAHTGLVELKTTEEYAALHIKQ